MVSLKLPSTIFTPALWAACSCGPMAPGMTPHSMATAASWEPTASWTAVCHCAGWPAFEISVTLAPRLWPRALKSSACVWQASISLLIGNTTSDLPLTTEALTAGPGSVYCGTASAWVTLAFSALSVEAEIEPPPPLAAVVVLLLEPLELVAPALLVLFELLPHAASASVLSRAGSSQRLRVSACPQ